MDNITLSLTNDIIKRGHLAFTKTACVGAKLLAFALYSKGIMHSHISWDNVDGVVHIDNKLYEVTAYNEIAEKYNTADCEANWRNYFCPKKITLVFEELN